MTTPLMPTPDPKLDLQFERIIDVPRELVWEAWTTPAHLLKWFTPAPWRTTECEIDLRPGGMFRTVMCSPEGELFPGMGSYVEVVPNERLVWTNDESEDASVTTVTFEAQGEKTLLVLRERYPSKEALDANRGAEEGLPEQFAQLDELLEMLA